MTTTALAVPPDVERLYDEGKAELSEAPAVALGRFKEALRLAKGDEGWTWRLLLAVALAYQTKNESAHAIEYYRRFLAQTDAHQATMTQKWKRRRAITGEQLVHLEEQVEATHGFVSVTSVPTGAAIIVDSTRAGADRDAITPFGLILEPGKHIVQVSLDGYATMERMVTVRAGDSQPVRVELVPNTPKSSPAPAPAPAPAPKPAPTVEAPTPEPTVAANTTPAPARTVAITATATPAEAEPNMLGPWVTLGASAVAAVAGVAMTVLASEERKQMDFYSDPTAFSSNTQGIDYYKEFDAHRTSMEGYEVAGGVLYGIALAGVTTGVIWMLLVEPSENGGGDAASIVPELYLAPMPHGLAGQAHWSF